MGNYSEKTYYNEELIKYEKVVYGNYQEETYCDDLNQIKNKIKRLQDIKDKGYIYNNGIYIRKHYDKYNDNVIDIFVSELIITPLVQLPNNFEKYTNIQTVTLSSIYIIQPDQILSDILIDLYYYNYNKVIDMICTIKNLKTLKINVVNLELKTETLEKIKQMKFKVILY
jgi:hypothetical protein